MSAAPGERRIVARVVEVERHRNTPEGGPQWALVVRAERPDGRLGPGQRFYTAPGYSINWEVIEAWEGRRFAFHVNLDGRLVKATQLEESEGRGLRDMVGRRQ